MSEQTLWDVIKSLEPDDSPEYIEFHGTMEEFRESIRQYLEAKRLAEQKETPQKPTTSD